MERSVSCVPDAMQRERQRSGASLIRDRYRLERSRVCSASLRAALRPGHERRAPHFGETNPSSFWRSEAKTTLAIGVVPAKAGTHDHRRWLWVPALRPLSRASAGTTIAWSARSTNLRVCEITAGAISLFRDCYLQWMLQL